jgi:hypothetical protein
MDQRRRHPPQDFRLGPLSSLHRPTRDDRASPAGHAPTTRHAEPPKQAAEYRRCVSRGSAEDCAGTAQVRDQVLRRVLGETDDTQEFLWRGGGEGKADADLALTFAVGNSDRIRERVGHPSTGELGQRRRVDSGIQHATYTR